MEMVVANETNFQNQSHILLAFVKLDFSMKASLSINAYQTSVLKTRFVHGLKKGSAPCFCGVKSQGKILQNKP